MPIRHDDPRPPYLQLAAELRQAIDAGEYEPGERLPSQRQLAFDYGIAPMTVRRALDQLAEEGLVVAQQGRGHFVQDPDDDVADRPADGKSIRELLDESTRQLEEAIRALDEANARLDALEAGGADPGMEPPVDPGPDRSPGIDL